MTPVLDGKSIGSDQTRVLKGELLIWRTKNQARDQGTVKLKDPVCFESVQIGSEKDPSKNPWFFAGSSVKLQIH
jgi:hypothetical protein